MALPRLAASAALAAAAAAQVGAEAPLAAVASTAGVVSDGFDLHLGPSSTFCGGRRLYNGKSAGQADCEAKCAAVEDCKYYNYWASSGWCRLSQSCSIKATSVSTNILVYMRTGKRSLDYEIHMEGSTCKDAPIFKGQTDGVEDCAEWCLESPTCRFFSVMAGGWCTLTANCDDTDHQGMEHSDIYKLPDPITATKVAASSSHTGARIREAHADAISIEIFASVSKGPSFERIVANGVSACTMQAIEPSHIAFSYKNAEHISATVLITPPPRAKLEQVFDWLEACDTMEAEVLDGLRDAEQREVVVDFEPLQLVDTAGPANGWCCLGSWLFDDPCSECTPVLTERGVAARGHPCAASENACLSCNETWAEPTWCPREKHVVI